ncbi:GMC oxidoreductase [Sphingomonas glacialis]|nr:GMC oxidoreductase [Sphingomonas glacialis]
MSEFAGEADVIIIGSGPAGVSAAWPLVNAGVRVLMLDASDSPLPDLPTHETLADFRADPARWRTELGAAGPLADGGVSPKLATALARATVHGFADRAGVETENYMALGSHAAGGLSRIWGALAARYDQSDLACFPGDAAALVAGYESVAQRIGVSGGKDITDADLASLAPSVGRLARRHGRRTPSPGFRLITAPNAVLAEPRDDRLGCTACGLCLHGCSRGSIYHSALELPALRRFRNFRYRAGVAVQRLAADPSGQIVEARIGTESVHFRSPVAIVAAGTLMTTSLALRRIGLTGVPVRLESNPVGGIAFLVPDLVGRALPDRAFGLGQLFYTLALSPGIEAAGVFYGADTLPLAPVADRMPFTRPFALKAARALAPALVLATTYLPGRFSDNSIQVDEDGAAGRIRITGRQSREAEHLLSQSFSALARVARGRGAWAIPGSRQTLMPGADAHPAGTLPMGATSRAGTSAIGELNGAPGIFIADGAALPVLSGRHPTLTIMANADRLGRALARRFAATPGVARAG